MLTQARLKELLSYDPETGAFTWIMRTPQSRINVGDIAGRLNGDGYWHIGIDGGRHGAHRLAWLYMTGAWPKKQIDHIDGRRANNCFKNLRDVSSSVNGQNRRRAMSNSKTGLLGVSKCRGTFQARIMIDGKSINLGMFATPELAHASYLAVKREIHLGNTL